MYLLVIFIYIKIMFYSILYIEFNKKDFKKYKWLY